MTCATRPAYMRRNESAPSVGRCQPIKVIKITSYPGVSQVISDRFAELVSQISLNMLLHRFFQFRPLKECSHRTAARRHVFLQRIRFEYRCTTTSLDRIRHQRPPRRVQSIDLAERPRAACSRSEASQSPRRCRRASCARKINRRNAIRERRDRSTT